MIFAKGLENINISLYLFMNSNKFTLLYFWLQYITTLYTQNRSVFNCYIANTLVFVSINEYKVNLIN